MIYALTSIAVRLESHLDWVLQNWNLMYPQYNLFRETILCRRHNGILFVVLR